MKFILSLFFIGSPLFAANTTPIKICGKNLKVEIVQNEEEKAKGLMDRKKMPEDSGMLFIYEKEEALSFWMKNTYIPLSIGFFDKDKKLIDIQDMKPLDTTKIYVSKKPAQFAIEVNKGWFTKNKVDVGCKFEYAY